MGRSGRGRSALTAILGWPVRVGLGSRSRVGLAFLFIRLRSLGGVWARAPELERLLSPCGTSPTARTLEHVRAIGLQRR